MKKYSRLRMLSYAVILYLILAFTWWSVLLFIKNRDAFRAKAELLQLVTAAEGRYPTEEAFLQSPPYLALQDKYYRQEWMILGEAAVFVVTLIIGIWLINRGYNKEILATRQRRNFLLSITHELKSPIASIRLVLETLRKRQLPADKADQLQDSAIKEVDRLNKLVNDLLLSARLETAYRPVFEEVDLTQLLREVADSMERRFPGAHLHLQTEEAVLLPRADRLGLTSVIQNLIENAIKYSEGPARIALELSRDNREVLFAVADQGIGIPDREKERIFDKFYRVGNEDTRKTKGTGLGLYIVRQIVLAHHGRIEVSDNQPQGTIFRIWIPV